jgi:NAD(P)H-nitrite reductase large subunit
MESWKCNNCGNTINAQSSPEICPSCDQKGEFINPSFNTLKGGILQRDKKTYALAPHIPGGIIFDFNMLRNIADVAEKYGAQVIKITSAHRLAIVGFQPEDIDRAWKDLGLPPSAGAGLCVRSVKLCPGTAFCQFGTQDSVRVGLKLDEKYHGMSLPYKFKIGVSGCPNTCAESSIKDVGLIGIKKGWRIVAGGFVTSLNPRLADVIADGLNDDEAIALVDEVIQWFRLANKPKRLGKLIDKIGLDKFKEELGVPNTK